MGGFNFFTYGVWKLQYRLATTTEDKTKIAIFYKLAGEARDIERIQQICARPYYISQRNKSSN